jgi:hypothetical protein
MATPNPAIRLSRSELHFWRQAFLVAMGPAILKRGGTLEHPAGAAHKAAERANYAVREDRRVRREGIA